MHLPHVYPLIAVNFVCELYALHSYLKKHTEIKCVLIIFIGALFPHFSNLSNFPKTYKFDWAQTGMNNDILCLKFKW